MTKFLVLDGVREGVVLGLEPARARVVLQVLGHVQEAAVDDRDRHALAGDALQVQEVRADQGGEARVRVAQEARCAIGVDPAASALAGQAPRFVRRERGRHRVDDRELTRHVAAGRPDRRRRLDHLGGLDDDAGRLGARRSPRSGTALRRQKGRDRRHRRQGQRPAHARRPSVFPWVPRAAPFLLFRPAGSSPLARSLRPAHDSLPARSEPARRKDPPPTGESTDVTKSAGGTARENR